MLLREHAEPLEADFQRYYQLDLGDLWRGHMSPRRVATLATQLPAGAQTWAATSVDSAWTVNEHLTATVVDVIAAGNWQRAGDSKATRPEPLLRPSQARAEQDRRHRMLERAERFRSRVAQETT